MEILVGKYSGFCQGVRRAVNTALSVQDTKNVYIFGEIVHNPDVIAKVEQKGIKTVHCLKDIPDNSKLIIRSHGVGQDVYAYCKEHNIIVTDCTCAFVRKTQRIVKEESEKGKTIVIIGEATHPEVIGLLGWCKGESFVFSSEKDDFSKLIGKEVSVVSQTTFSLTSFEKIIKIIQKECEKKVAVFQTICYTTKERQKEAAILAKQCDGMLVIGGLNSSNTNKLYQVCKLYCKRVVRLPDAASLEINSINNIKRLGIVMGASTPNEQTQEVLTKMETIEAEEKATTMEEVVANMDDGKYKYKKGDIVNVIIASAEAEGLLVSLPGAKKEILIDKDELECEAYDKDAYATKIGEEIEVMVVAMNPIKFSQKMIKKVKEEEAAMAEIEAGKEFSVTCIGFNKGGLTAELGTYAVFIPAKEIRSGYVKDLEKYVGKKLRLKSLDIRKERRKEIIASQRVIIEAEKAEKDAAKAAKEAEFFANIHVGDIVDGKVERVTDFGAFVSVNGFDCLAHISDLSWTGCKVVTDVLTIGNTYSFKVLKVDDEKKKVSIGYKQLQAQPWDLVADKYAEGDVIHGKVVRIVPFGAFVEVEKGIDGLVHVSQISHEWLENPTSVLTIGEEIDAKILALDPEAKKMTLSIKALQPKPEMPARKPRAEKPEDYEDDRKGSRRPRRENRDDDEMKSWKEDDVGGASIADLLGQLNK